MRRSVRLVLVLLLASLGLAGALGGLGALAPVEAQVTPSAATRAAANPLAGPWAHSTITTRANPELLNYNAARDTRTRAALARIAFTPKARWFANCKTCNVADIRRQVATYVADTRRNDPDTLVQLAIFGLWPDGEVVNGKRPRMSWTPARYRGWIQQIALGIGDARAAIVLEPDLAISANHRGGMVDPSAAQRISYTAWAASYLSRALPRATIYLDAGSADWLTLPEATRLLRGAGVGYVRGFALGATHYDSVADNVAYAARLSQALAKAGVPGRRAVIDTADNGTPFTWLQWRQRWGAAYDRTRSEAYLFDNTPTCGSRTEKICQTLGHRPTWNVLDGEAAKLGLGTDQPELRRQALTYVDAYLWFGRGWRWMQQGGNDAQTPKRSVRMALFTRFIQATAPAAPSPPDPSESPTDPAPSETASPSGDPTPSQDAGPAAP